MLKSLSLFRWTIFLIAVPVLTSQIEAQLTEGIDTGLGGANVISGTVITTAGRITTRVTIRLMTAMRGDRVGVSDELGNFAFRGLPSGTYTIVIDKEKDFEPFTQSVEIIQLRGSPPQTYTLSVRLKPRAGVVQKPSVVDAALSALPERGKTLFQKAKELGGAGDHAGAVEQLSLLTAEFPSFMMGFNELGLEYMRLNQLDKADEAFQVASKLQPDAFQPQLNRGMVLVYMKKYAEAERVLRSAKKLNEQSGPVRYFLGQAVANLGKFDDAEKELTAALSMGGEEMKEAHRTLAIIYNSRGEKKKAIVELEAYLKLNPTAPDAEQLRKIVEQLKTSPQ